MSIRKLSALFILVLLPVSIPINALQKAFDAYKEEIYYLPNYCIVRSIDECVYVFIGDQIPLPNEFKADKKLQLAITDEIFNLMALIAKGACVLDTHNLNALLKKVDKINRNANKARMCLWREFLISQNSLVVNFDYMLEEMGTIKDDSLTLDIRKQIQAANISLFDWINSKYDYGDSYERWEKEVTKLFLYNDRLKPEIKEFFSEVKKNNGGKLDMCTVIRGNESKLSNYIYSEAVRPGQSKKKVIYRLNIKTGEVSVKLTDIIDKRFYSNPESIDFHPKRQ